MGAHGGISQKFTWNMNNISENNNLSPLLADQGDILSGNTEIKITQPLVVGFSNQNEVKTINSLTAISQWCGLEDLARVSEYSGLPMDLASSVVTSELAKKLFRGDWFNQCIKSDGLLTSAATREQSLQTPHCVQSTIKSSYKILKSNADKCSDLVCLGKNDLPEFLNMIQFDHMPTESNTVSGTLMLKFHSSYNKELAAFDSGFKRMLEKDWGRYSVALAERYSIKLPYVSYIQEALSRYAFSKILARKLISTKVLISTKKSDDKNESTHGLLLPEVDHDIWDSSYFKTVKILSLEQMKKNESFDNDKRVFVSPAEPPDIVKGVVRGSKL